MTTAPRPRSPKAALLLIGLLATTTLMTGCIRQLFSHTPGGDSRSTDTFTYVSTPFEPLTVTLYDHRDNDPLWTVDVPIGQKVTIRFLEARAKQGTNRRPDVMQWAIYDESKRRADLTNMMAVPPADSRLIWLTIRESVEYPLEDTPPVEFEDPEREWIPVEPRRFRGVPLDNNAREGAYISDS